MMILVTRKWFTSQSTCGELIIKGELFCYTLEPPTKTDNTKPRAIPAGTYDLTMRFSPRHNRILPHIENVPDFDEIEIHPGNYPRDTEGCVLVGSSHMKDVVLESDKAFNRLLLMLGEIQETKEPMFIFFEEQETVADGV